MTMEVERAQSDLERLIKVRASSTRGCIKRSTNASLSFNIWPWLVTHIGFFCLPVLLIFIGHRFLSASGIFSVLPPGFLLYLVGLSGFWLLLLIDLLFPSFTRYSVVLEAIFKSSHKHRTHWSFITSRRWRQYLPPEDRCFSIFVRGILASSIALSIFGRTTIAEIHHQLSHHRNPVVQRSLMHNPHYFETAGPFPRILCMHQTISEAGVQPDSHIYVKFLLPGGASTQDGDPLVHHSSTPTTSRSHDKPDPRNIIEGRRHRKQVNHPNNGETELAAMEALVERISKLARELPPSVPTAARDGHIARSLNLEGPDGDAASRFNRRMDVIFGEDLRDASGRLKHVATGKHGMFAVVKYLKDVPWAELQLEIVRPKLQRIVRELEYLCSEGKSQSKRKSPEVPDDNAEDAPEAKRTRTQTNEDDGDFQPAGDDDILSVHDSSDEESHSSHSESPPKTQQKTKKRSGRPRAKRIAKSPEPDRTGDDGMLLDIEVQEIAEPTTELDPSADVVHFSGKPFSKPGGKKSYRICSLCRPGKELVSDVSTHRRHYAKFHKTAYHAWCSKKNFDSKLEEDVKARKEALRAAELKKQILHQQTLDPHLRDKPARPAPYTDELFLDAAIDWLIVTDQPVDALTNPKFREMIDIAARATDGVNLPTRAQTRAAIVRLFHDQMNKLQIRLHSDAVRGMIHITCDAWQASNTDGYFAVTGHWIEETSPGAWVLREAILGFTRMNNAHHGVRLGQTLFKIVQRLGIAHRVGYVTCDNASNNGTMLAEFARQMIRVAKIKWDPVERRINCLAHVINIATQKLISTYSKSEHYNPHEPHAHVPETAGLMRDEIGLLRAIAVKERSSSQRKELFRTIQLRAEDSEKAARQMILDMKVRWSSTYAMLDRGHELKEAVDAFVAEIAAKETDREKSDKLEALQLSEEEWERVELFLRVLQCAQDAQHQFSSDLRSTLHLAIPALEKLHAQWTAQASKDKYSPFHHAIKAALSKVDEYYQRTGSSNSYVVAMVLDPRKKFNYFEKNWARSLNSSTKIVLEQIFKDRYNQLQSETPAPTTSTNTATSNGHKNRRRASTPLDEDINMADGSATHIDPSRPWLDEFNDYLQARETVPQDMSAVEWWGRNYHRYPVWGSLARDYLAIMASSVSSERAFSSAGITISKRRNRLKADIVEALQCLKCFILRKLLFREPVLFREGEEDVVEESAADNKQDGRSWDILVNDDPDNYEFL